MTLKRALMAILVISLIAPGLAFADYGYETVYSGIVNEGQTITANGCYVKFLIGNGSSTVEIKSPNYATANITLYPGHPYSYYNALKVYIIEINETARNLLVDISRPSGSGDVPSQGGTKLSCDTPGQMALAGDIVNFPIVIQNNNNEDKTYTLSSYSGTDWKLRFTTGDKGIYKVFVPKSQSKVVNLEIQTTGSSTVGEKKVTASIDDIKIDLYVYITSVNQTVDVSTKFTSKISSIGEKIFYDIRLKNLQSRENIYKLSVTGLPENWYYRYLEDTSSTQEVAEVIVSPLGEKMVYLEIVPPYSVDVGDYNFSAIINAPDGIKILKDFSLKLKSGTSMSVTSSKLAYEGKPGEELTIDVYVSNTGKGAALTNVYLETKAPDGWLITVSPNKTNSIKAGELQVFRVTIMPPGNIVASDYEVNVKVKSDQAEKEKDYRITIKTESYVPYLGGALILVVAAGLFYMYRKYGRR